MLPLHSQPLVECGQHHAGRSGILVPYGGNHDHPVALLGGQHQVRRPGNHLAVSSGALQRLEHVGDIFEADQQVIHDLGATGHLHDSAQDAGGHQGLHHQAPPAGPRGIQHQEVSQNGGDPVPVHVHPGAVGLPDLQSDPIGIGIAGKHQARADLVGEIPGRCGGLGHLRIGGLEGNDREGAVGVLTGRGPNRKVQPAQQVAHRLQSATAEGRVDHGQFGPRDEGVSIQLQVSVQVALVEILGNGPHQALGKRPGEGNAPDGSGLPHGVHQGLVLRRHRLAAEGVVDLDPVVVGGVVGG